MARKPTRFWHPARRLLHQAREKARALIASPDAPANLDDVRPRLQHYLRAMYGETVTIESLASPKKTGWAVRSLRTIGLTKVHGASESDAACIRLPASLPAHHTSVSTLEQYRLLAVQHAERMRRASASHASEGATDLERDLFQLAEAAAIDAQILASQPGLRAALNAARAESMAERPKPRFRTDIELRVEEMVRRAWPEHQDAAKQTDLPTIPLDNDAESNAVWARRMANELEAKYGRKATTAYRRVPEITLWQTAIRTQLPGARMFALETETPETESQSAANTRSAPSNRKGNTRAQSASDEASTADSESGGDRDSDSDDHPNADDSPESSADSASEPDNEKQSDDESEGARSADGPDGGGGESRAQHSNQSVNDAAPIEGIVFRYPEWDFHSQGFHPDGAIVRVMPPSHGSSEWATSALKAHARETHRARQQFERLRSERSRLRRQLQGDELDLEACVEAMVDRRMGAAPTDRLYSHVRPGRRELAITLLIDVSGSTGDVVAGEERVIDVERVSAIIATAAFDALGDDYSILAFSSAGASNVRVHTLKEFAEKNSSLVLERISALAPHGTTRLGAAVRHATATLSKHPAPHHLLLILSDGKPYDYDWYFTDYAVQDSRQAVMHARLQGIHPFCITVDAANGETYLAEIFGLAGYRVVSRPSQLSQALLLAVERLIGDKG